MVPLLAFVALIPSRSSILDVKVTGQGRPVILIPGLTCDGSVWDETVAHLKERFQCHVLTLPGFAGRPPIEGPYLSQVRDAIIRYVDDKHLRRPAVIGHSLGGFMSFYLSATAPSKFGPIVAVDGVPWLSSLTNPNQTVEKVRPQAEQVAKMFASLSQADYAKQTLATLNAQMQNPQRAAEIGASSGKSDPKTVGMAASEMMLTDIRKDCAKITSPVLLIAAGEFTKTGVQLAYLRAYYKAEIANVPNARLLVSWKSRHFIMVDDLQFFLSSIDRFFATSWSATP